MLRRAILRRTVIGIATLFVVSVLIFTGTSVLPGDVAQIILGQMATPESLAALRAKLGLDQPAHVRYFLWLGDLLTGDLGISKAGSGFGTVGTAISTMISARLWNTFRLAGMVAMIAIPLSLTLGLSAAMYPGTRLDRIVTFSTLSLISVPEFLVATFLVLILAVHLGWLPSIAYMSGDETGWQLIRALAMPTLTLVIVVSAQIIRMTRATVLNVMSSP
ncbi:MAG: ABC transporter permease, partial [Planctomycetes bacterium]|nr:ABC transporter permease [Planctomycetota bacterium]